MKSLLPLYLVALIACSIQTTQAGILIGTSTGNDSVATVNQLIMDYNNNPNNPDLALVQTNFFFDRFDDSTAPLNSQSGFLDPDDFTFYQEDDDGSLDIPDGDIEADVFSAVDKLYELSDLNNQNANPSGFGIDENVQGFVYNGTNPNLQYYTVKSGSFFSLWLAMDGFNPVYTDNTSDADGATIGFTSNTGLAYDPLQQGGGVSHISFYSNPEPSSFLLFGLGMLSAGAAYRRQRRKSVADSE